MKERIRKYIKTWRQRCYSDLPDEAPVILERSNKVPSYRIICLAIMKNDVNLETLGFSKPVCRVYSEIKRQELIDRGDLKPDAQLKLKI